MRKVASVDCRGRRRGRSADGAQTNRDRPVILGTQQPTASRMDEDIHGRLGAQLRALYQKTLEEPIPQRFLDLLHQSDSAPDAPPADKPTKPV